jgi:hypothetical protein
MFIKTKIYYVEEMLSDDGITQFIIDVNGLGIEQAEERFINVACIQQYYAIANDDVEGTQIVLNNGDEMQSVDSPEQITSKIKTAQANYILS